MEDRYTGIDPIEKHLLERRAALNRYTPMEGNVPGMKITWSEVREELLQEEDKRLRLYRESLTKK